MRIRSLMWNDDTIAHLWDAHRVTPEEIEDIVIGVDGEPPHYHIVRDGSNYRILGRTGSGRLLIVIGTPLGDGYLRAFAARDMNARERRTYRIRYEP